jgi:membrane protein
MTDREQRGSWVARSLTAFANDHCALLAAAISYHVLFAFVPLITFLVAMFGLIMRDPAARQMAADRIIQLLPLQSSEDNLVLQLIRDVSGQTGTLTVISLIGLAWSSIGIFGSIRSSLNIAWCVRNKRGLVTDFLFDVASLLGFGLLFATSMAGTLAVHSAESSVLRFPGFSLYGPLHSAVVAAGVLLPAVFSFIGFLLLFRFIPNVIHKLSDVWIGALVAALLFEGAKHGFAFYVAHFNRYQSLYGALGGVMLFMLWTYVSAVILLIGAEITAERERRLHGKPIPLPDPQLGKRADDLPRDDLDDPHPRAAYLPR